MTATITSSPHAPAAGSPASSALSVRRWFLVLSPVLAGALAVVGAAADPAAGISGRELFQLYADNPGPLQIKSLALHWSYAFWIAPALLVAPYVRARGAWIANVAAVLGFAGMTTLPGLLFIDWYDSAIGQLYGADGTEAVATLMEESMWGLQVFVLPGLLGFALGLPLAAVALWRAGRVRWWAPVAVVAGFLAFMLSNVMWWGCVLTTLAFTVFAVALERGTRHG